MLTELETPVFRSKIVGKKVVCRHTYLPLTRESLAGNLPLTFEPPSEAPALAAHRCYPRSVPPGPTAKVMHRSGARTNALRKIRDTGSILSALEATFVSPRAN